MVAAVLLVLCMAVAGCSSAGSEAASESVVEPPFDDCVSERQPAEESPRILLESSRADASGSIPFAWAEDIDEANQDIGVHCWTGDGWKLVWFVRDYARSGRPRLVLTEEDNQVYDYATYAVPGDLRVPAEAPPGWYRAGGGPTGERGADFEVVASDTSDG